MLSGSAFSVLLIPRIFLAAWQYVDISFFDEKIAEDSSVIKRSLMQTTQVSSNE